MDERKSSDMGKHTCNEQEGHKQQPQEYAHKVEEVRAILAHQNVCVKAMDDAALRRFLRARDMDVKAAAKMAADDVAWRMDVVPPRGYVLENEVESELSVEKAYLQGASKEGYPVLVMLAHRHMANKKHPLQFKRFVVYTLDKTLASAPEGVEKCLVIVDLKGVGYKNMDMKAMLLGLQILQNHYPESLAKLYFVNVSSLWIKFWNIVSHLVDKVTLRKFKFLSSGDMVPILEDVDEEVLPVPYGGKAEMILIQDARVPSWPPTL